MNSRSSKTDQLPPAIQENNQLVVVGRVRRPHGVRGEVVVEAMSDAPERFAAEASLLAYGPRASQPVALKVASSRPHRGTVLVRFVGVADRDRAEELRRHWLAVDRDAIAPAPEGSFYFFELLGCEVVDARLGSLGQVTDVIEDGGGTLLQVRGPVAEAEVATEAETEAVPASDGTTDRREVLIPFVDSYLGKVEPDAQRIEVKLPEGFIEACSSKL